MIFYLKIFKLIYFLFTAAIICISGVSVVQADSNLQYLPVTQQSKDLLSKYKCKYIFKIKTRPPLLKKGAFSGIVVKDLIVPVSLKLSFKALNENYYRNIDLNRAKLLKENSSGKLEAIKFYFKPETQYHGVLKWNASANDKASYYFCVPAKGSKNGTKPDVNIPLFMDGGVLRKPGLHKIGGLFYFDFFDINQDGKKDIISGGLHDFIRVHENIAASPKHTPLFSENHTYNLADKDDLTLAHDYFSHGWKVTSPVFYDFNKDGKKDILMGGTHSSPKVRYWQNIGTAKTPVYGNKRKIKLTCSDGYKRGLYPVPCDMNGDGRLDLIAGTMFPGGSDKRYIYFFEGLSKRATDFKFKPGVKLKDKNGVIRVPGYSNCTVEVVDWNKDGLDDLFAASVDNLFYWENQGTNITPLLVKRPFPKTALCGRGSLKVIGRDIITGSTLAYNKNNKKGGFASSFLMSATPSLVTFGGHSTIKITDWNKDGKKDIVYSTDWGKIICAINDGEKWKKRIELKSNGKAIDFYGCVDPGENNKGYTRMTMADLNGDGLDDLLINHELAWRFGYLPFYKNLGNGSFAKGRRLELPCLSNMKYGKGIKGKAAIFDKNTILDYFSYPAKEIFNPAGGEISLYFAPQSNSPYQRSMYLLFNQAFKFNKNKIKYGDVFKVAINSQGSIFWRAGSSVLKTIPLKWIKNKWYKLSCKWGKQGMIIMLDDKLIASNKLNKFQRSSGPRLYIGGQQSISFIQKTREYKFRRHYHKNEYRFFGPAVGMIDEVKIKDADGNVTLILPMDGNSDGFNPTNKQKVPGGSLNIAYRAAPEVADLNADGLPDLILPICPNPNKRGAARATLYWLKNTGSKTKPQFLSASSLKIDAGVRSATRFVDFDKDGDLDLLLIKFGANLEYYVNTGTAKDPCFKYKGILVKQAWGHEAGVDLVDWNNDGQEDIVLTNGDNGSILIYDKQFLDKLIPRAKLQEIITSNQIIKETDAVEKTQIKIKNVYSDCKNTKKAENVCNDIEEGGSVIGWWGKRFPRQLNFEFEKKEKISQIDCYWGHPTHALNNLGGARDPKSFLFEYWTGSSWKALFQKVKLSKRNNNKGLGKTVSFNFPTRNTNKIRLTFYSSYDTGKSSRTKKIKPEKNRAIFIREINFYKK